MVFPQNQGLADSLAGMQQQNMARRQRPLTRYQPSPGDQGLSGAGAYATGGLAGRMTNYGAQQNYAQTGYMPNRTVGGAYGLGGQDPLGQNRLGSQQVLANAMGNQYAPMHQAPLGIAPTTQGGYDQQMAQQNQGGRFYGGALPTQITSANGTVRPGWMAAPVQPAAGLMDANGLASFAQRTGNYYNPQTGQMGGNPATMGMNQSQAGLAGTTGRGPGQAMLSPAQAAQARAGGAPGPNQIAANARYGAQGGILNRVAIRQNNANARQQNALAMQQQQQMMGLAATNPGLAMQMAQMNQRGQLAQAQMGLNYAQLAQQGMQGHQQSQDRRYVADQQVAASQHQAWGNRYAAAIKDGHTPDDAMKMAGPPPAQGQQGLGGGASPQVQPGAQQARQGLAGAPGAGGGYKPKKSLLDAQRSQIAALPPSQRAAALRGLGVTDPGDLHHYQSQIDPHYNKPTTYQGIVDSPLGAFLGAYGGGQQAYGLGGLLGLNAPLPPVVGLSPQARRALGR